MTTAGNRASTGVNVRAGGASLGGFTVQAVPVVRPATTIATTGGLQSVGTTPFVVPATSTISAVPVRAPSVASSVGVTSVMPSVLRSAPVVRAFTTPSAFSLVGNAASLISVAPISRFPAMRFVIPMIPNLRRQNDQVLSLSHLRVTNTNFTPISLNGISSLRPEIVALTDFKSVIADNNHNFTKAGKLLDLQFQAKSLREKTLLDVINNIRGNPATTNDLDQIQAQFFAQFQTVDQLVAFYRQTINTIENLKTSFDIKNIPDNLFNTNVFQNFRTFYQHRMEFPINSFNQFSNTKLLYQMMFDFRAIMENYSLNLLNLNDPDRTGDSNPILIDKSYTTTNGFSFTMDLIRSFGATAQNAADDGYFIRFLHALPSVVDDRIKLLLTLISKEFRISSGLGQTDVQHTLTDVFGASSTDGNPFDNIIGTVGNTALDAPLGTNSLSSVFFLDGTNNSFILPFETKYIDATTAQKVYVPGTNYFIDSILNITNNEFNTGPFIQYVQDLTTTLAASMNVVEKLYDFKSTQSTINGPQILRKLLAPLRDAMGGLGTNVQLNISHASIIALFRLTAVDNQLKEMLFQYILLRAMDAQNHNRADLRYITLHIVNEINDLNGLSYVRLDTDTDPSIQNGRNLTPFIRQLETDIQNRVFELVGATVGDGHVPVRPVTDPRDRNTNNSEQQQTDNTRGSNNNSDDALQDFSPSDSASRPVGSHRTRLGFDVDSVSALTSAMAQDYTLIPGLINAAIECDVAASPGTNTAIYVDSGGRTRFNQLSATTLMLMLYETMCGLVSKYTSSDFTRSSYQNTCDMLVDQQFNDVNVGIIEGVIGDTETILTPYVIGIVPAAHTLAQSRGATAATGGQVQAAGGNGVSPSSPGTISVSPGGGTRLTDMVRLASSIDTSLIASRMGISPGAATGGTNAHGAAIGTAAGSITQRVSTAAIINLASLAQNPSYMVALRLHENSLYSIKQKLYEEDLVVANILHILSVIYGRLANAKDSVINYFNQATINNFLNQSHTSPNDLATVLNPAQVRVMVYARDAINRQLHASGDELGQPVGFVSSTPNDVNVKNSIISLMAQPDYQERNMADEKLKILTIGIPSGFSKNLAERVDTNSINRTSFTTNKDFDVVDINVHKRNLEHEELVFKPKKFLFDLSLFSNGFQSLNVTPTQDFNALIQSIRLYDYQNVSNPDLHSMSDINNDQKYNFLTATQQQTMFKNHVVSDVLNAYLNYMTAMRMSEDVFVDIHSSTYNLLQPSTLPGTPVDPLSTLTADFQTKVVRFLNVVKHKNLPPRPITDLLNDDRVDQESKDILRTIAFGNAVFNPTILMQKLLSPKLFDRVYTVPINVDAFPIDVERTNTTSVGRMAYEKLQQQQGALTTDSNGEVYLAARDKQSPVFEDYFVTVDLSISTVTS